MISDIFSLIYDPFSFSSMGLMLVLGIGLWPSLFITQETTITTHAAITVTTVNSLPYFRKQLKLIEALMMSH